MIGAPVVAKHTRDIVDNVWGWRVIELWDAGRESAEILGFAIEKKLEDREQGFGFTGEGPSGHFRLKFLRSQLLLPVEKHMKRKHLKQNNRLNIL